MAITKANFKYDAATQTRSQVGTTTTYVGRVIDVYNREYRAMSDVYTSATFALVWDDEKNAPVEVLVDANFECDMSQGKAVIDADEATLVAYRMAMIAKAEEKRQAQIREAERLAELARNAPARGKRMRVVRGRKVAKGTEGVVFWVRDGRVGLDVTGEKDARGYVKDPVWVSADYVVAV